MKFTDFPSVGGRSLDELERHLELQRGNPIYEDVPLSSLGFDESGRVCQGGSAFPITSVAVRGVSRRLRIPFHYLVNSPTDVAVFNLNSFLPRASGNARLVIEEGTVVGVLPGGYEPVKHGLIVDALKESAGNFELHNWRCSNDGLFMRYTSPTFAVEPTEGDIIRAGVDVSNPDCDKGRGLDVTGTLFRLVCSNGAVIPEVTFRRRLRTSGWQKPEEIAVHAVGYFNEACQETVGRTEGVSTLPDHPIRMLDVEQEEECREVLRPALKVIRCPGNLTISLAEALRTEDETLFGLYNAVTRLGRDAADPALQNRLELGGFRVIKHQDELAELLAP